MRQKKVRYEMINKYGYVRVSTKDQNEDRQLEAMKQLEILEKIFMWKKYRERILTDQYTKNW